MTRITFADKQGKRWRVWVNLPPEQAIEEARKVYPWGTDFELCP